LSTSNSLLPTTCHREAFSYGLLWYLWHFWLVKVILLSTFASPVKVMVQLEIGSASPYALTQLHLVGSFSCLLRCRGPEASKWLFSFNTTLSLICLTPPIFIMVNTHSFNDLFRNYFTTAGLNLGAQYYFH